MLHGDVTDKILASFYHVYNTLGYGFLEKVYENALRNNLRKQGFHVEQQVSIRVYFEGEDVGEYFADLIVNRCVIVEIKASNSLDKANENQLLNYLKATRIEVGLLINFGAEPDFKRKIFTNDRKDARPALK